MSLSACTNVSHREDAFFCSTLGSEFYDGVVRDKAFARIGDGPGEPYSGALRLFTTSLFPQLWHEVPGAVLLLHRVVRILS